jgi:hypothetical protein
VRAGDRVEVAGEVEVDVLHRHDLGVPAAGRAALHAKARAEARLAQADDGVLADPVEPVVEADRGRGLAFARRGRVDRGDEDQLAVGLVGLRLDPVHRDLGLEPAIGLERFVRNAEALGDLADRLHRGCAGDLDIGGHRCPLRSGFGRCSLTRNFRESEIVSVPYNREWANLKGDYEGEGKGDGGWTAAWPCAAMD